jgi:hypothetical protein
MKKIIATIALTAVSTVALATDLTTSVARNHVTHTNDVVLTVGEQFGDLRGELVASRDLNGVNHVTNLGAKVGYPLAAVHGVTFTPKVGVNYLNPERGAQGYGITAGVSAAYPLTATTTLVGEVTHLRNENALRARNGNSLGMGVRTSF